MLRYLVDPIFQVINTAGKPATGGYIEVYLHGTRDKYYCASDFDGTLHPFRIPLDSLGSNIILADDDNAYDIYVYNRYGSLLMSRYNVTPLSFDDIAESLARKKDKQNPISFEGYPTKTLKSITQDANGEIDVDFEDIAFPHKVLVDDGDSVPKNLEDAVMADELGKLQVYVGEHEDSTPEHPNKVLVLDDHLLREDIDDNAQRIENLEETIAELDYDSVPHAYLHSTLAQSAGDSSTTRTPINVFAQDALEGDCFDFEQTTSIDDTPFGYVWIEPGTYLINASVTLQWVGNPRGTFVAKVGSVMGENFDFSQEQEIKRNTTKVVTIPNRMKLTVNITYDAGTPVMGFWIQSMQVVKLAGGMSQTNVAHDSTLTGKGSVDDPLRVNVPNVDIVSPNNTITVTATIDAQTNAKTFKLDVANGGNSCGWFNSAHIDTVGNEEVINVDRFRVSEGQTVIGNGLEFIPNSGDIESGVPFGKVYANTGIYFVSVILNLLWSGAPVNKICNVAGRQFDFTYNHEEKVVTTQLMRFNSRTKMSVNISLDSDIPAGLRIWVERFQIFAINAGNLEIKGIETVEHDETITGTGTHENPLSIQSVLNVCNANTASEYDPTATYPTVGTLCYDGNVLYKSTVAITTAEPWTPAHWTQTSISEQIGNVETLLAAL